MDRLERLVNLVAALLDSPRPLSRAELRQRVGGYADEPEAFRRNFERDKDALRQMGMPLVLEPVEGDDPAAPTGYRIPRERYELPEIGLTEEELAALRVAASAVQIRGGEGATASALRKLAGGIRPSLSIPGPGAGGENGRAGQTAAGEVGAGEVVAEVPGGEAVATAFSAISERRRVSFDYRDRRRTVEPWQLSYRGGLWYLEGREVEQGERRLFRLDRISGPVAATGGPGAFERPEGTRGGPTPPWQFGEGPEVTARLLVDATVAPIALARTGEEAVAERREDGSVVLALAVTDRAALFSFVLGFLERAEILAPPDLRAEFVAHLRALAAPQAPVESEP